MILRIYVLPATLCLVMLISILKIQTASAGPILHSMNFYSGAEHYTFLPDEWGNIAGSAQFGNGHHVEATAIRGDNIVTLTDVSIVCSNSEDCHTGLDIRLSYDGSGTGIHDFAFAGNGSINGYISFLTITNEVSGPDDALSWSVFDHFDSGSFNFGPYSGSLDISSNTGNVPLGAYHGYIRLIVYYMQNGTTISFPSSITATAIPVSIVPEPSLALLLCLGLAIFGLVGWRWK